MSDTKTSSRKLVIGGVVAVGCAVLVGLALDAGPNAPPAPLPAFVPTGDLADNDRAHDLEALIKGTEQMASRMQELSRKGTDWGLNGGTNPEGHDVTQ